MKNAWIFLCLMTAGILLFSGIAAADDDNGKWGFKQGDWELTLAGVGTGDEDFDNNIFSAQVGLGYYMSDCFELAYRQDGHFVDPEGPDNDRWSAASRGALDIYLPIGPLNPYIGFNGGYIYGDLVNDQWIMGPEGGLKIFAGPSAFIFGSLNYEVLFENIDDYADKFDNGTFIYSIGVGLTF